MYTLDEDLLPSQIYEWMVNHLRMLRSSKGHGSIELRIEDGYISTYWDGQGHRNSATERRRRRASVTLPKLSSENAGSSPEA